MNRFAVGDLVKASCGGPPLVVAQLGENDFVVCVYFTERQGFSSSAFPASVLKRVQ